MRLSQNPTLGMRRYATFLLVLGGAGLAHADTNSGNINFSGGSQSFGLQIGTALQITAGGFVSGEYGTPPFGFPDINIDVNVPNQTRNVTFQNGSTSGTFNSTPTGSATVTFEDFDQNSLTPLEIFPGSNPTVSNLNINIGSFFLDLAPITVSGSASTSIGTFDVNINVSFDPTVTFSYVQAPGQTGILGGNLIPGTLNAQITGNVNATVDVIIPILPDITINAGTLASLNESIPISLQNAGDLLPGLPSITTQTQIGIPTPGNRVPAQFEFDLNLGQLGIGSLPIDLNETVSYIQDNPDPNPGSGQFILEDVSLTATIVGAIEIQDLQYHLQGILNNAIQSAQAPNASISGTQVLYNATTLQQFISSISNDPEGGALSAEWDIGGSSVGSGNPLTLQLVNTGITAPNDTMILNLTVTDNTLQSDSDTILLAYSDVAPVITQTDITQSTPYEVEFDGDFTDDDLLINGLIPGFEQHDFEWDVTAATGLGDFSSTSLLSGSFGILTNADLIAALGAPGNYTVFFNVIDNGGNVVTIGVPIEVLDVPEPASLALLGGLAAGGMVWYRRCRKPRVAT